MNYIDDATLDRWIKEDAPFLDLTTHLLGIGERPGRLTFRSRGDVVVCGTEEVRRIIVKLGGAVEDAMPSGRSARAGQALLTATGTAATLHLAWKVCVNILEYASGIATRTRDLVLAARAVAPHMEIVSTRKGFPGTRELASKAVLAGGGSPHRLGLSETILVFPQHRAFLTSAEEFARQLPRWKARSPEKKFLVEAAGLAEAFAAVRAGADGIQFDKISPSKLAQYAPALRAERPGIILIAAGGITIGNVAAYAASGVDALATSTVYHGPPADIAATMDAVD
jgi:molybdenum transport protein